MTPDSFKELMDGFVAGTLTGAQKADLSGLLHDPDRKMELEELFPADLDVGGVRDISIPEIGNLAYQQIRTRISEEAIIRGGRFRLYYWAAAVLVLALAAGWWWEAHLNNEVHPVVANVAQTDLKPGGNHAVLTLGDGKSIILDSAKNGTVAMQGTARVKKLENGKLQYEVEDKRTAPSQYNTLSTPRGGQYQLTLPDGTIVWLDAASSITYPTAFSGGERRVKITGEAYFDVAHDPARPFQVKVNGRLIEALGTRFNINAYNDEPAIQTTLLDGIVRVSADNQVQLLQPGQQAQITAAGIRLIAAADTDAAVGWTRGDFVFNNTPLPEVMRQLGRWYNVDVRYDTSADAKVLTALISRNRPASAVLNALIVTGFKFNIIGTQTIEAVKSK
jgi:transmembrane sensor